VSAAEPSRLVGNDTRMLGGDPALGEGRTRGGEGPGQESGGDELIVHGPRGPMQGRGDLLTNLVVDGQRAVVAGQRIGDFDESFASVGAGDRHQGACLQRCQPALRPLQFDQEIDRSRGGQVLGVGVEDAADLVGARQWKLVQWEAPVRVVGEDVGE
jgi:hypothetical protein